MIGDRLTEYRTRAGLSVADFAELLGLQPRTYYSYLSGQHSGRGNDPLWGSAVEWSRRIFVSLDWLAGLSATMWARHLLQPYAEELQRRVSEQPPASQVFRVRVCDVVRMIYDLDCERFTPLCIAALLRLPRATVEAIVNGETRTVPEETTASIQLLFGISDDWLHTMEGRAIR